jgi:hypothetical protein
MNSRRISRRSILAATAASALLLPLLRRERAYGADPVFPKRIIFVVTGNGSIEELPRRASGLRLLGCQVRPPSRATAWPTPTG